MTKLALQIEHSENFPAVIEANGSIDSKDFNEALKDEKPTIREQLNRYGVIHFKGFNQPVDNFDDFMKTLLPEFSPFDPKIPGIFSSGRRNLGKNVVNSTYLNKRIPMAIHNEFNYMPIFPRYIAFRCVQAPSEGGETTIADSRKIYQSIDPSIREKFEQKGVKYTRNYCNQNFLSFLLNKINKVAESWEEVFKTDTKAEVENICRKYNFDFTWKGKNALTVTNSLPAIRQHPETNEKVWFNQACPWVFNPKTTGWLKYLVYNIVYPSINSKPLVVTYGDDSNISPDDAAHVVDVMNKHTVGVKWENGDTLLIDNLLVGHARNPYKGERVLAAAMCG